MTRIVRRNYPLDRLPTDLRPDGAADGTVTVVVETDRDGALPLSKDFVKELESMRARAEHTADDAVERIRRLRDEWPD